MNIAEKLLGAIDAAISEPPRDPHALAKRLADKRGFKLSPDEISQLKSQAPIVDHCQAHINDRDANASGRAFRANVDRFESALSRGESPEPLKSRAEIEHQFALECESASRARDAALAKLRALAAPIAERFAQELEYEAAKVEQSEKALHEEYGTEHSAGGLVHKLRAEANKARSAARTGRNLKTLLPFIEL